VITLFVKVKFSEFLQKIITEPETIRASNVMPFPVAIPNKLTTSTLGKSRRGEDVQEFESLEVMFDSWKK
jgi:hypothetical protein